MRQWRWWGLLASILWGSICVGYAQHFSEQVTKITLDNGLRVLFVRNGTAPVMYFNLLFDVGGIDEPDGTIE